MDFNLGENFFKITLTKCRFFSNKWEGYFCCQNVMSKTFILDRQVPPKFSLISEGQC